MGQDQIVSKKTGKITVNEFPFDNKVVLETIEYLLKTKEFKRIGDKEAEIGKEEHRYKFKTLNKLDEPHKFTGFAELHNKEGIKIFEGEFLDGCRSGFGVEYDLNGNVMYEGCFEKNLYHGWGVTPKYSGEYLKGKKSGWGVYEEIDKTGTSRIFYEGFWLNDHFHGIGSLNVRGDQIELFLEDNPNISLGNYEVKYVGQWNNGMISGSGKMVRKGEIYTGDFVEGNYEGDGILSTQQKPMVKGKFLQGKLIKEE